MDTEKGLIGRVIGPYRVLHRLGGAAGAPLYVGEHLHLDRKVAVKVVGPQAEAPADARARFLAAARAVSSLRHENVLGPIDIGETGDGHLHVALEFPDGGGAGAALVSGETLADALASRGPFPGQRARVIARQLAAALRAVAERALTDVDIDPARIILSTRDGRADFVSVDLVPAAMSAPGDMHALDGVQTLGRLLYQMLVGRAPEQDKAPEDPTLLRPDLEIPADLDALVMRALDPDPAKRWPDVASMFPVLFARDKRLSVSGVPTYTDPAVEVRGFGRKMFSRPSPRALISGGVAAAVTLVLGLVLAFSGGAKEKGNPPAVAVAAVIPAPAAATLPAPSAAPEFAAPAPTPEPAAAAPTTDSRPVAAGPKVVAPVARAVVGAGGQPGSVAAPATAGDSASGSTKVVASGDESCAVTLGSRPWSEVWIDGHQAGFTPLVDYPIDCGAHDIIFKSSESELEKRVLINVAAGQTLKKIVDLAPAPSTACALTLGSRPWSEVWIDGKHAGVTPLVDYEVPCGKHEVVFKATEANVEKRETVVVKSGQTLKKVVALLPDTTE